MIRMDLVIKESDSGSVSVAFIPTESKADPTEREDQVYTNLANLIIQGMADGTITGSKNMGMMYSGEKSAVESIKRRMGV